jgi:N-acyl-L-homoserine lactone synthetase
VLCQQYTALVSCGTCSVSVQATRIITCAREVMSQYLSNATTRKKRKGKPDVAETQKIAELATTLEKFRSNEDGGGNPLLLPELVL